MSKVLPAPYADVPPRRAVAVRYGGLVAVLLVLAAAVAWWLVPTLPVQQPARTIQLTIGDERNLNHQGEGEHLYNVLGWGERETSGTRTARRAGARASFVVPLAMRTGAPVQLTVETCGCGISDGTTLTVNDSLLALPMDDAWRVNRVLLPQRATLHGDDLYLAWQSTGTLGPQVSRVTVQGTAPPLLLPTLLVAFGTAGGVALLAWRRRAVVGWLLPVGVLLGAVTGYWLYPLHMLPWLALLLLGAAAAVAIALLEAQPWRQVVLWGMVLWVLAVPALLGTWLLDDAFISFRYARNLVDGYGLTFNPGGERVEGYTNFLWVLLVAAALALGAEPVVTTQVATTGIAVATVLLLYAISRDWWRGSAWALLPPVLLALNPAYLLYSTRGSGMETALVALLTLLALWLLGRAAQRATLAAGAAAGLACALLVMARPDGALVPFAGGVLLLWYGLRATSAAARRASLYALAGLVGGFVLLYAPYFAWRYSYYGYLLPNTFYAKTGATGDQVWRGVRYAAGFFAAPPQLGVLLLAAVGVSTLWQRPRSTAPGVPLALLGLFVALTLLYVVAVGGDHFPQGRFFISALPVLAVLAAVGTQRLAAVGDPVPGGVARRVATGLVLGVWLIAMLLYLPTTDSRTVDNNPIWREHKVALKNMEYGYWLRANTPPDAVIATGIAGALPYYAERYVIDTLGLNDTHIAHLPVATMGQGIAGAEKTDLDYVLDQQPDYLPLATTGDFLQYDRFTREYVPLDVPGPRGGTLTFYVPRSAAPPALPESP